MTEKDKVFSVAPMMGWTDRHCRHFLRTLSRHAWLYTEMVTTQALMQGDAHRHLQPGAAQSPVVLQLGGHDPDAFKVCARLGHAYGYDHINLNVGCPSNRVRQGRFGACLMAEPERVADMAAAVRAATVLPVSVKTRLGIDDLDRYDDLYRFVTTVARSGCDTFIVHARKAWLRGLSPKENRAIPPLRHDVVHQLKRDLPQLRIILNGGITDLEQAKGHLQAVNGVMIGRAAYHQPYLLAHVDHQLYGDPRPAPSRRDVVLNLLPYVDEELRQGARLHHITRHLLGLFHGTPGARAWRRHLSAHSHHEQAGPEVLEQALAVTESSLEAGRSQARLSPSEYH